MEWLRHTAKYLLFSQTFLIVLILLISSTPIWVFFSQKVKKKRAELLAKGSQYAKEIKNHFVKGITPHMEKELTIKVSARTRWYTFFKKPPIIILGVMYSGEDLAPKEVKERVYKIIDQLGEKNSCLVCTKFKFN